MITSEVRKDYQERAQQAADRWGLGDLRGLWFTSAGDMRIDTLVFDRSITDRITAAGDQSFSRGQPIVVYPSELLGGRLVLGDGFHRVAEAIAAGEVTISAVIEPLGQETYEGDPEDEWLCPECGCPDVYFGCVAPSCAAPDGPLVAAGLL